MRVRLLIAASLLTAFGLPLSGCQPRRIDVDEQSESDIRTNRGPAPPTGLKQNPGRPKTERPSPPPGPSR